jgi:hypothetical protein
MTRAKPEKVRRILVEMTALAQAARDAHEYNTVKLNGKVYPIREPWEDVDERAAVKFTKEAK